MKEIKNIGNNQMQIRIYRMPCPKCGELEPEELGTVGNIVHLKCKKCGTHYDAEYKGIKRRS